MTGNSVSATRGMSKGSKKSVMNKPYALIASAVLLAVAHTMPAQHQHGGAPSGGGGATPGYSSAMGDFQKAIMLQASEMQSAHLRSWTIRTAALDRQVEAVRQRLESKTPDDLSTEIEALKPALTTDNLDRQEFVTSLSSAQHSGLKKPERELDRVNKDMATALSEITRNSGQIQDKKLLVKGLQRAKKAIAAEQHKQQELAREMGVTV